MNLDQQQLAQTLNVSDRTIRQWQNEGLPVELQAHGGNRYRLSDCIEWVVRRRFGNELVFEKTRLTKAQADKTEVEIRLLQLELLNSVDVENTWSTIRDELREEVETIPQRITPALLQQRNLVDVEQSLEDLLNEALAALTKVEGVFLSKKVL